jgi:hypothetical protein
MPTDIYEQFCNDNVDNTVYSVTDNFVFKNEATESICYIVLHVEIEDNKTIFKYQFMGRLL